ncbi:MAG: FxsA family protein [Candidatus Lambdaproteobacteria bacterium]|nr:FxsA family protein [Candidatus Lambdaproteobacteria bacterium]
MWLWIVIVGLGLYTIGEVWLLLTLGRFVGSGVTVFWLLGTLVLGAFMVRWQGLRTFLAIHRRLVAEELPTGELVDMALVLLGGFLLVAPGFLGDLVGFALLFPPGRWLARAIVLRLLHNHFPLSPSVPRESRINGEPLALRPGRSPSV